MNIGHKKSPSELEPPRLLTLLAMSCYGVFSGLIFFSSSVLFSTAVKAHPNFDPQYDDPNNYQYNYQYDYQYNKEHLPQSVGHTGPNIDHSPFIAYPEMIDLWEFADNNKNHRKHDRKRFDELSPAQREQIKKRRERFKALPPEEKERIYRAREEFHNMPPEKRQRLKEKWRNMSPEERKQAHKRKHRQKENK